METPPNDRSARRLRLVVASFPLYLLAVLDLRDLLGQVAYRLSALPVIASGWSYGTRTGAILGAVCLLAHRAILLLIGAPLLTANLMQGVAAIAVMIVSGGIAGRPGEMQRQVETQLAERERAAAVLRESEERYRHLLAEAQHQAQALGLRDRVRTALIGVLDLPTVYRAVVEAIAETYGHALVGISLLEGDDLVLQHQVGYERVIARIPIARGVMGRVVREARATLVTDARRAPDYQGAIDGITSEVCAPIFDDGRVIGALNVESAAGISLGETDLRVMEALCG